MPSIDSNENHNTSPARLAPKLLVYLLVALGVALQVAQYLWNRDLRLDEAAFALNLIQKSHVELLGPMDYSQNSPMLFLMVLKTFLVVFGYSQYALRFIPLISAIATLPLVYLLAYNITRPDAKAPWHAAFTSPRYTPALIALAFLAVNKHLIFFASDLRQYATNIVVVAVLYLYVIRPKLEASPAIHSQRYMIGLILLGAISVWISLAAIFVVGGIGATYVLFGVLKKDKKLFAWAVLTCIVWLGSFFAHYAMQDANIDARDLRVEMVAFQGPATAPIPPMNFSDLKWFRERFEKTLYFPGGLTYHGLGIFVFLTGVVTLLRRNHAHTLMLLLPAVFALLASSMGKYPFAERYLMFLLPAIVIFLGEGIGLLLKQPEKNLRAAGCILLVILYIQPFAHGLRHVLQPREVSEITALLDHFQDNRREDEIVYCSWFTAIPTLYYQERYGFTDDMLVMEPRAPHLSYTVWEHRAEFIPTLHESGHAFWLLFEHDTGPPVPTHIGETDDYGRQLEVVQAHGATLYKYEQAE